MIALRNLFLLLVVVLPVWSCATGSPPADTSNKKLAAAITQLEGAARTVEYSARRGLIPAERAGEVKNALLAAQTALGAWKAAPDSLEGQDKALAALQILQVVLDSITTLVVPPDGVR